MNLLVIDTETFGLADRKVYNVGWTIYDTETQQVIKERNYLINQFWRDKSKMQTAYYANKIAIYEDRIAKGIDKVVWFGTMLRILNADLEKYQPTNYAYNSRFDNNSIQTTCDFFGKENPFENPIVDIMDYLSPICDTNEYVDFCVNNGYMTKHRKPRPQRKAETLFRYLTNNTDYVEEHTALEDSKIELEILLKVLGL